MINLIPEYLLQNLGRIIFMMGLLSLITIGLRNFCLTFQQGISYVRRLHQIPCSRCIFFTGDYRLKCTVHPYNALTETALNCSVNLIHNISQHSAIISCPVASVLYS